MRRCAASLFVGSLLLAGCLQDAEKPKEPLPPPMATTDSNQAVIYVPMMVCESCPVKVAEGLAMLPWIEAESILPDRKSRQVRFRVKDPASFDFEAVKETIARKGFKDIALLTSPETSSN